MVWVKTTIIILLIAAILETSNGYTKCRKVKPTHVDEEWVKEVGESEEGWYFPMHSNCDNCKKSDHAWTWLTGRSHSEQQGMCWKTDILTRFGPMVLPFNCKYYRFEDQICELDTTGLSGKIRNRIGFGAEMILTLSDNKTFIAGASCVFGMENWWWVASTEEELSEETKEIVEEHFEKLGFKTENVAKEGNWEKSPVIFKKFHIGRDAKCEV